jgi:DNA-directed RNA polymerase subunit L
MKINVIKEDKTELEIEVVGEGHTLCNALRETLGENKEVLEAKYRIEHPLLSDPRIFIKVKEGPVPRRGEKIIPLTEVKGIGPKRAEQLEKAGIKSANDLVRANLNKISEKSGISVAVLEKYFSEAEKLDFGGTTRGRLILKKSLKDLAKTFSEIQAQFEEAV